jgi:ABC-type uncharacterized transport system involved in gliding motility auxiliary subunit
MSKGILSTTGLVLALILFLAVNILAATTLRSTRVDLTESRLYTLSDGTRNVLADLDEEITLRFFFSKTLAQEVPGLSSYAQRVRELLEEYAAQADGKLTLIVSEPVPFSEEEDRAVSYGLRGAPASAQGDLLYFGLAGTNTTDDTETIPFFTQQREEFLEYDLTKLVYNLAHTEQPVVGLITQLPMQGGMGQNPMQPQRTEPWVILSQIEQLFEVRKLDWSLARIPDDVRVLMVVHPKDLPAETAFAIDQFVLGGGHALVFVDPFSEADRPPPDQSNPMAGMGLKRSSNLPELFAAWGVEFATDDAVADRSRALRVGMGGQGIDYVPWLALRADKDDFAQDDAITAELGVVHLASAGILRHAAGASTGFHPLLESSDDSMPIKTATLQFQEMRPDPAGLLDTFQAGDERLVVAARIDGPVRTAFPDGKPGADDAPEDGAEAPPRETWRTESDGPINVIVVADADLLQDRFWTRVQNFLGQRMVMPLADNADFVVNACENLAGSNDLISLRSRGTYHRPFDRVVELRREAEDRYRAKEAEFEAQLRDTEQRIADLQQGKEGIEALILSPEQRAELEQLKEERVKTRKGLREVRHQLDQDIERLGARLELANVLGVPALVALAGLAFLLMRRKN